MPVAASQRAEGIAERRARYHHEAGKGLAELQDQENGARSRQRKESQKSGNCHVQLGEQAEACEYDDEPEDKNSQKRCRYQIIGLYEQQQTGLRQISADLRGTRLKRPLQVVLRRQGLNPQV